MDNNFSTLLSKSTEYYDNQNNINKREITNLENILIERQKSKGKEVGIIKNKVIDSKNNIEYEYELLGLYDINSRTFVWSWSFILLPKYLSIQSKYLLHYGLNIGISNVNDTLEKDSYFLKILLCNSRIHIEDEFRLNFIIAVCSYILNDRIDFIIKRNYNEKHLNAIEFYIVKKISNII